MESEKTLMIEILKMNGFSFYDRHFTRNPPDPL